ncbi:MAG: hypothetical protein QOI57_1082, partial [Rubrobacteraceae bacterium]|nr:hypothetical protein [Rubrobacteraceae bacterium]
MAVLVILLLLALLVPQACQALLGSGEEPGSGTQGTSDLGSPGGGTNEETTGGTEDQSGSSETDVSDGASTTSGQA